MNKRDLRKGGNSLLSAILNLAGIVTLLFGGAGILAGLSVINGALSPELLEAFGELFVMLGTGLGFLIIGYSIPTLVLGVVFLAVARINNKTSQNNYYLKHMLKQ